MNFMFAGLNASFWASFCLMVGYIVSYLSYKNLPESFIGIILSSMALLMLFFQPFWNGLADKMGKGGIKKIFIATTVIGSLGVILLYTVAKQSAWLNFIFCMIYAVTVYSTQSLLDSWVVQCQRKHQEINYGLVRGTGSIVYALSAMLFGVLISSMGYNLLAVSHTVFSVITIFIALSLPDPEPIANAEADKENVFENIVAAMTKSREFLVFLIAMFFIFTGHMANINYFASLIAFFGGTEAHTGTGLFVMAAAESLVVFSSGYFMKKFEIRFLMLTAMFFFILRNVGFFISANTTEAIIVQALQSLSFGLFMPVSVYYATSLVEERYASAARGLVFTFTFGLGAIVGNYMGGYLIEHAGIKTMYLTAAVLQIIGFAIYLSVNYKKLHVLKQ